MAIDISGAYFDEGWDLIPSWNRDLRHINLNGLEGANCYCDEDAAETVRKALGGLSPEGCHWIDTGDYHYLSYFWMEKITGPFRLVLFDNHPDDQEDAFGAGLLSCGGWVKTARERLPMLKEVLWNCTDAGNDLPVFLSIDIDVLAAEHARTDWNQGGMSLDELRSAVAGLKASCHIIGTDICGGITAGKGGSEADFLINRNTKLALMELL